VSTTEDAASAEAKHRGRRNRRQVDQSPLAEVVGYRLRLAQLTLFKDFNETFEHMNIKPVHYSMLRLIEANPGLRQGELARALGIKRANMVSLINGLEERGLAERRAVPGDRRSHALHLTGKGENFTAEMQGIWHTHENRMIERLGGEAEKAKLVQLLDRLAGLP
jgi:DNA-binding MarR family transcriptional regulator